MCRAGAGKAVEAKLRDRAHSGAQACGPGGSVPGWGRKGRHTRGRDREDQVGAQC